MYACMYNIALLETFSAVGTFSVLLNENRAVTVSSYRRAVEISNASYLEVALYGNCVLRVGGELL